MKMLISPAKSLDFSTPLPTSRGTQPVFLDTTARIHQRLVKMSRKELSHLMHISDKLAELNYERFQEFSLHHTKKNSRPALYAFAGDVYTGLDAYSLPVETLDFLQSSLRILSGFYGILRPLDIIQPYRLEMGTRLSVGKEKDLYELWQEKLTTYLKENLKKEELLINLASKEYFKAVKKDQLNTPLITPVFKDFKNGKLRTVPFFAKKARGAMVRHITQNRATQIDTIKTFNWEGYAFSEEESTAEELVFTR